MSAERELYRLLFEAADEAVLLVQDNRLIEANASALALFGCSRQEILGQNPLDILVGDHSLPLALDQALSGQKQRFEGLCRRPDGITFPARVSLASVGPDQDSGNTILQLSIHDMTETRQLELKLRTMSQIVEQSPASVVVTNTAGEIEYVNPKFTKATGYTAEEAIGQNPRLLKSGEKSPGEYKDLWATIISGGEWRGEFHNRKKNGDLFWEYASISAIKNPEGEITHFLAIKEDITERKRFEEQQRLLLERRGRQVRLGTQIAQEIAAAADLQELYRRVVNQVKEQFGYYYAQVLRYEPLEQTLILVAGSGETGEQMLAEGHRMVIGAGLIGTAAASGESVLRAEVALDLDWRPNRLLPETRGELAVPIKLGTQVLGVLDVQSSKAGALDTEDQLLLEGLCGQIAIAIESTRLRQEMEERLRQLITLQRLMSQEAWQAFQTGLEAQGYLFEQGEIRPVARTALPGVETGAAGNPPFLVKPLAIRGQVIGGFGIFEDPEQPLSAEDQVLLESVSLQVAEAMERARLLEQTRKRAVELQAVAQVGTAAATILTTGKLLQTVVDLTKTRFGLYHVHIYLLNEAGDTLTLAAGAGEAGRTMVEQGWQISLDHPHSLVALTARKREGIITNDVRQSPDYLPNPLLPGTRSEMAVPLIVGERLFGVLDVQADTVNYFTGEDMDIQTTLAAQVAVALQNARHYQQTEAALAETELLYQASAELNMAESYEAVLAVLRQYTLIGQEARMIRLNYFDHPWTEEQQPGWINVLARWDENPWEEEVDSYPLAAFPSAQVLLRSDEPTLVEDIVNDPRLDSNTRALYHDTFRAKSALLVPLVVGGRWIGYISTIYGQATTFPEPALRRLATLTGQAAVAVQTIHLLTQMQDALAESRILYHFGEVISREVDLQSVYDTLVNLLVHQLDYSQAWIAIINEETQILQSVAGTGTGITGQVAQLVIPLQARTPGSIAARERQTVIVNNPGQDERTADLPEEYRAAGKIIASPLFTGGKLVGVAVGVRPLTEADIDDRDGRLLQAAVTQAAVALQRAQLFSETQAALAVTENLYEAGQRISAAADLQEVVAAIAEGTSLPVISRVDLLVFERNTAGEIESIVLAASWHSSQAVGALPVGARFARAVTNRLNILTPSEPLFFDDVEHDDRVELPVLEILRRQNTRSMVIIPLWLGARQLGVILLGADNLHRFTEREMQPYLSLAPQVAVALDNRRLLAETQAALDEVEATQRRYTLQAWEAYITQRRALNIEQVREGVSPLGDVIPPAAKQAITLKQTTVTGKDPANGAGLTGSHHPAASDNDSSLVVPLTLRGEVIGVLGLQEMGERQWSPEEIALVEAICEQLAGHAENLRLIDETQQRAAREARVNQIGEKIQAAQSLEEALQIAVSEVGRSLRAPQTTVQLEVK